MARLNPRAQALALATTELVSALHRAVEETLAQHEDWTTTEALAVVTAACARVTTNVSGDMLRTELNEQATAGDPGHRQGLGAD